MNHNKLFCKKLWSRIVDATNISYWSRMDFSMIWMLWQKNRNICLKIPTFLCQMW